MPQQYLIVNIANRRIRLKSWMRMIPMKIEFDILEI
jgi:hypothetical protein